MTTQKAAGSAVAGKYLLLEQIGEGGMAVVWRAEMRGAAGFARPVAIKKMKAELRSGQDYVAMFIEEARVGAELQHPNIVQVLDFCEDTDGLYCLVMEWIDGIDLRALLGAARRCNRRLPWGLVAAIGVGSLRGLSAAHERVTMLGAHAPVIHRDVSPSNIMIGGNGIVKLADFGLARARDRMRTLTAPGIIKGKLAYIAPEIARGSEASPQSDVFGMGCVLWEALAGKPLYEGAADIEIFHKVREGRVRSLLAERNDLPRRLVEIVHQALAKYPGDRFPSARDMALALEGMVASARLPGDSQQLLAQAVREARALVADGAPGVHASTEILEISLTDLEPR
jgi:serine/threonine-protein kinase